MNITKETKWQLSYCCHDNSYATGPVLIKTKIPKFHLTQGSSTPKNLIGRVKTMWEPCPFPGRPPVPPKKVANGDIWFYTERDWNQYGVISPPKFDFCFRCSVHILCLCSAIRHYSLAIRCWFFMPHSNYAFLISRLLSDMLSCYFMLGSTCLIAILCLFFFLTPDTLEWLTVVTRCTFAGSIQYGG